MHSTELRYHSIQYSAVYIKYSPFIEFSNISNIVGIGHNIIHTVNRLATKNMIGPIIFNCATNGERTGLTAITVAALQALQYKQPVIASE